MWLNMSRSLWSNVSLTSCPEGVSAVTTSSITNICEIVCLGPETGLYQMAVATLQDKLAKGLKHRGMIFVGRVEHIGRKPHSALPVYSVVALMCYVF